MATAILMPTHNEGPRLNRALQSVRERAADFGGVIVCLVDDGGQPAVALPDLPTATQDFRIVLARHAVNLGQGAALETARQLALRQGAMRAYITMDADGQHSVEGALALQEAIVRGADVAFGNRFRGNSNVPWGRSALVHFARLLEWAITGVRLSDAHNGLRGFSARALAHLRIRQNRMAHATEIRWHISRAPRWRVVEVPVSIRYTRNSLAKGQRASGALTVVQDLVTQYLFGDSI